MNQHFFAMPLPVGLSWPDEREGRWQQVYRKSHNWAIRRMLLGETRQLRRSPYNPTHLRMASNQRKCMPADTSGKAYSFLGMMVGKFFWSIKERMAQPASWLEGCPTAPPKRGADHVRNQAPCSCKLKQQAVCARAEEHLDWMWIEQKGRPQKDKFDMGDQLGLISMDWRYPQSLKPVKAMVSSQATPSVMKSRPRHMYFLCSANTTETIKGTYLLEFANGRHVWIQLKSYIVGRLGARRSGTSMLLMHTNCTLKPIMYVNFISNSSYYLISAFLSFGGYAGSTSLCMPNRWVDNMRWVSKYNHTCIMQGIHNRA